MRIGMFVTATFHGQRQEVHATVPATADVASARSRLGVRSRRAKRSSGASKWSAAQMLPGNMQEIVSGLQPGQQVVSNALVLQNTVEQ